MALTQKHAKCAGNERWQTPPDRGLGPFFGGACFFELRLGLVVYTMNPMNASNTTAAVTVHFSNVEGTARLCGANDGRAVSFNSARSASGIKRLSAWTKRNGEGWVGHMCAECCKARLESV